MQEIAIPDKTVCGPCMFPSVQQWYAHVAEKIQIYADYGGQSLLLTTWAATFSKAEMHKTVVQRVAIVFLSEFE
jgi:hypothetical protein